MTERRNLRNENGVVLDWLLKVGVWIALIGVVLFDAGAIVVNTISLDSTANDLAIQLSRKFGSGQTLPDQVTEAAEAAAEEAGVRLVKAEIDEEGILRIKVRRRVDTLIVEYIGPIEDWAVATADGKSDVL